MRQVHFPPQKTPDGTLREPGIGDCLFLEPALRHLSQATGEPVRLALRGNASVRDLFAWHPHIELLPEDVPPYGRWDRIDNDSAYRWSTVQHSRHAVDGYYHLLGLDPDDFIANQRRPLFWGPPLDRPVQVEQFITIAPFSNSCASSLFLGRVASKQPPLTLWEEFAYRAPLPVVCPCHPGAPTIDGVRMVRGLPLRDAARMIRASRALVCISTGLTAIAGAMDCNIAHLPGAEPHWFADPLTRGRYAYHYSPWLDWTADDLLRLLDRVLDRNES